jgi:SagB-type dehydrogenase family enzyme
MTALIVAAVVGLLAGCTEAKQPKTAADTLEEGKLMQLPEPDRDGEISFEAATQNRRSRRVFEDKAITRKQLGQLLWCAQGMTDPQGLKIVPSAGATFPLEVYAVVGKVEGMEPGLYRYLAEAHSLEVVKVSDLRAGLAAAALSQQFIARAPATIVIAADYGRTAGRYGQRAVRYVHMEVGHAGQNIYLQCETLGLGTCAIGAFEDSAVKKLLGIKEEPLYLMPVGYAK